jgi:hypothetical protein
MLVWESLLDVLGSATAATLVRRAVARGVARAPGLKELTVVREGLEYRCVLPPAWLESNVDGDLRVVATELGALLRELTGDVILSRLRSIPEVKAARLFVTEDET